MSKPVKNRPKKKSLFGSLPVKFAGGARSALLAAFPYFLSLTIVGALVGGIIIYAVNSPAFQLREVKILNAGQMTTDQSFEFCDLRPGENLITLDLVAVQQVIRRKHPEYKEVKVSRALPNRVEVLLKRRTPAAQLALGSRFVQVDRDLVVLPGSGAVAFKNLTIIEGSQIPKSGLFVGSNLTDVMTKKAMKLSEIIKQSDILKGHSLTAVDVRDAKNVSFYVDGAVEVRIGNNHFSERLKILEQTMKNIELDPSKVRYVDLRFDDVVIGPR